MDDIVCSSSDMDTVSSNNTAKNTTSMSSVQIFQTVTMIYVLRDIPRHARTMLNITSVGFNSVPILMRKINIRVKLKSLKRKSMN